MWERWVLIGMGKSVYGLAQGVRVFLNIGYLVA